MKRFRPTLPLLLLTLLLPALPARAQMSQLDPGQLIEGLRAEGLRELLKHYVESQTFDDPTVRPQVMASMLMLDYAQLRQEGQAEAALEAFQKALEQTRGLIKDHYGHEQRPIWQTQLAEMLLFDYLEAARMNAGQFYEFGVPTRVQEEAFESAAVEALELSEDADVRFFQLQTELPKQADHVDKRVNTGLWGRMIREYYQTRTRYVLGLASLYVDLLPGTHAYYQKLGQNPRIVRQKKDAAGERVRLLASASEALQPLADDANDEWSIRTRCQALRARVLIAQKQYAPAQDYIEAVKKVGQQDMVDLTNRLAEAYNADLQNKLSAALALLDEVVKHPLVSQNLLARLMVVDARHRILLRNAQSKPDAERALAVTQAYQPYLDLLNDDSLGESAEPLRNYVHQRWVDRIAPGANLANVPAVVVAAMGQTLRVEGQNRMLDAGDEAAIAQAKEKLQRAAKLNADLLQRTDLTPGVRAEALFNQGMALYFQDTSDFTQIAQAAGVLTDLGDQFPDQKLAEQGISYAAEMLHQLHVNRASVTNLNELYERCVKVLLAKYPTLEATDNERFYYASKLLIPAQRWADAQAVLASVPQAHLTYFTAQRERLYCLVELSKTEPARVDALRELAEQIIRESGHALPVADADVAPFIRNAQGHARLVLAQLASDADQVDVALNHLNNFESDYASDQELLRLGLGRRILLLARAQRYDEAAKAAAGMMQSFPDDAAPVVDQVLTALDQQATDLRRQAADELVQRRKDAMLGQAKGMSETATKLAQLLVDWASAPGRGFSAEDMVPFKLILAKSLRTSGDAAKALVIVKPLFEQFDTDADVILEYAEALFAVGGDANLNQAAELFKTIIAGLPPDESGVYPRPYWNAWMRYFQICEKLNLFTDVIGPRIRSLEATDPNFGGEPFTTELRRLKNKYSR